jgi:hypothetical protein
VYEFFNKVPNKNTLVCSNNAQLNYFTTLLTPLNSFWSHDKNTPFFTENFEAHMALITQNKIPTQFLGKNIYWVRDTIIENSKFDFYYSFLHNAKPVFTNNRYLVYKLQF